MPGEAERLKVPVPTGLLLVGPPGYGKTSIAHLLATQTRRSFYPITPADVPTPDKLVQAFARARENSPSILFIDEIDGLLPRGDNGYYMGQHQIQLVEQALMLMSQLDPANQVFLVGTTNHIDDIDPRVLRGGRFTEKIEVCVPDDRGYLRLIEKYLGPIPLAAGPHEQRPPGAIKGHFAGGSAGCGEYRQANGDESHGGERRSLAAAHLGGFREGSSTEPGPPVELRGLGRAGAGP